MDKDSIRNQFASIAESPNGEIDLARAALLIAATEYPDLDIPNEIGALDSLAGGVSARLSNGSDPLFRLNTLSEYLFDELGFRGNQTDYYDPRNSFLNEVLSRRLGIPITLSLVYIEVGNRLGLPLAGVGMPGHFLVRHRDVEDLFIDPFHGGILLSEEECAQRLRQITQRDMRWDPRYLAPISGRDLIVRMLRNLKVIYLQQQDYQRALTTIDSIAALLPDAGHELRDRGLVHYRLGNYAQAQQDLQRYLASIAYVSDSEAVLRLLKHIQEMLGK